MFKFFNCYLFLWFFYLLCICMCIHVHTMSKCNLLCWFSPLTIIYALRFKLGSSGLTAGAFSRWAISLPLCFSFSKNQPEFSMGCEVTALLYMHAVLLCKSSEIPSSFFVPHVDLGYWCSSEQIPIHQANMYVASRGARHGPCLRAFVLFQPENFPILSKCHHFSLLFSMFFLTITLLLEPFLFPPEI